VSREERDFYGRVRLVRLGLIISSNPAGRRKEYEGLHIVMPLCRRQGVGSSKAVTEREKITTNLHITAELRPTV
jgi:hypothetical protein